MNARQENAALNRLLIDLGRSLLQYAREAWPWTDAESRELREEAYRLAEYQSQATAEITDYLSLQNWPIDFGIYPAEYTDLHYVALSFLMDQLIENADELVVEIHETRRLIERPLAAELFSRVEQTQKMIAARLRELKTTFRHDEAA